MQGLVASVMDPRLIDLLQQWRAAGEVRDAPRQFSDHADHLLVIDVDGAGNRYIHYGEAFVRHFGADLAGCVIDRLPAEVLPADRRGMLDFDYAFVRGRSQPLWRSYTAIFDDGAEAETWQRLVLPAGQGRLVVGAYPVNKPPPGEEPGSALLRLVLDRVPVLLDETGAITDLALSLRSYCDNQQHLAELEWRATRDSLTGIANRSHFYYLAGQELCHAQRMQRWFAMMVLDLDHFKRINDRWGHPTGDRALQAFVGACRQALREGDILGRIGGEEFAVALPSTSITAAAVIAERLRSQVEQVVLEAEDGSFSGFTVSIGIAAWCESAAPPQAVSPDVADLLKRADAALYRAKAAGRNRIEVAAWV